MDRETTHPSVLVIACGALAGELLMLVRRNHWEHVRVTCLPARLHNRPEHIPQAVRDSIHAHRAAYRRIFVAYGDCGTGGELDRVLAEEGVERIPGAHCYEFLSGAQAFARLVDEEPASFYLTDFLARHFDSLVIRGLGLDRYPELRSLYFGNYRKMVYLSQRRDDDLIARAQAAADRLGLSLDIRHTGLEPLAQVVTLAPGSEAVGKNNHSVLA